MKKYCDFLVVVILGLGLVACDSKLNDVPSLGPTATPDVADEVLSNEEIMLEFTACLRTEGLEVMDPVVDADGFVGKPEIAEGTSKEELGEAWKACEEILEGFTYEQNKEDLSDQVDYYVSLAECLREEGIDIEDPTATTLKTWMNDFKDTIDWEDPNSVEAYETCTGEDISDGNGKGK
jgi:hypothetical protein